MRTRRYRPKRTYRRTYKKRCGEGSVLSGNSYGDARILPQQFRVTKTDGSDFWCDQNGNKEQGVFPGLTVTSLNITPGDCIGLRQRALLYKHFRITGVKWHFYKDALDGNNGSVAYANYHGQWDGLESKVVYNPNLEVPPTIGDFSTSAAQYVTQQKGKMLPTLNGGKKNVWTKAMMNKEVLFLDTTSTSTNSKQLVKFPWLNCEPGLFGTTQYSTGHVNVYMPSVDITRLLNNPTDAVLGQESGGEQAAVSIEAFRKLTQKYQWYVRPQIFWQVKGKYYDNALKNFDAPVRAEDIVEHPFKMEPLSQEIDQLNEDLKMSSDM